MKDIACLHSLCLHECDIPALAEECHLMLAEVFPDAEVIIKTNQSEISTIADVDLLELALMNLIENAAKYSSRPAHIDVNIEDQADNIIIEVSDRGIGIPEADQEHL